MKTQLLKVNEDSIALGAKLIREGELVGFPTETVYGLGANALDAEAVVKIFEAKGRPQDNPLITHVSCVEEIPPLVRAIPAAAKKLMEAFFVKDEAFLTNFKKSSAAKSVHHGFVGGLLEHTLGVVKLCDYFAKSYPMLKRDLLLAAAMCHDIGKTKEISLFPQNDYTDDGQLLGHIVIGTEMVSDKIRMIPGFPTVLASELKHCILAHHGEYEYGSPKKPALMEAMALNLADNADAKLETFTEILEGTSETGWLGYNRLFESNLRMTRMD